MADCSSTTSGSSGATKVANRCRTKVVRKHKQELRQEREKRAMDTVNSDVVKSAAVKTTADKALEINVQLESLKCKYETDINKVTKLKDQELNKLRQDLSRCQLELREEVEKRGQSSSARSGFEQERSRLLGELRETGEAKRRLELALEAASVGIKRKTSEMRELREASKQQMLAFERSANNEIRKLLDELKTRDQQLSTMQTAERSGVSSKSTPKKNHPPPQLNSQPLETNFDTGQIFPNLSSNITTQRRIYILEKQLRQWATANEFLNNQNKEYEEGKKELENSIEKLQIQNQQLKCDFETIKKESESLTTLLSEKNIHLIKDQIESLKLKNNEQQVMLQSLQQEENSNTKLKTNKCKTKKTLRFLLPGDSAPTPNGKSPMFIDEYTMTDDDLFDNLSNVNTTSNSHHTSGEITPMEETIDIIQNENKADSLKNTPDELDAGDFDAEMMEDHRQLEASFELMLQQEMNSSWQNEKESLEKEYNQLKEQLILKSENEKVSQKCYQELQEKYENLEFKFFEMEGDLQIERKDADIQTDIQTTTDIATQSTATSDQLQNDVTTVYVTSESAVDVTPEVVSLSAVSAADSDEDIAMTSSSVSTNTSGFVDAAMMQGGDEEAVDAAPWMDLCEDLECRLRDSRRRLRQVSDRAALIVAEKERRIRHLELLVDRSEDADGESESDCRGIFMEMSGSVFDWNDNCCRSPSVEVETGFESYWQLPDDEEDHAERKMATLEKDSQALREIVEMDESIIDALQRQVEAARFNESIFQHLVERLEAVEADVTASLEETERDNEALHREIDGLEKIERMQRCTIAEMRSREALVNDRMSDMINEFNSVEAGLKRRLSDAQREVESARKANERLEDREGELEAVVDLLRKKIRNMQMLNSELQQQVQELPLGVKASQIEQACLQLLEEERSRNEQLTAEARHWRMEVEAVRTEMGRDNCRLSMQLEETAFVEAKLISEIQDLKSSSTFDGCPLCRKHSSQCTSLNSESIEETNSLSEISELPEDDYKHDVIAENMPCDVTTQIPPRDFKLRNCGSLDSLNDSGIDSSSIKVKKTGFLKPSKIPRNKRLPSRRFTLAGIGADISTLFQHLETNPDRQMEQHFD